MIRVTDGRRESKAVRYIRENVNRKTTPKYVKKQMRAWLRIAEGKDPRWMVSEGKLRQVEAVLKLLIMPKGLHAGETLFEASTGYQWLIYTSSICTVSREDPGRRRYQTVLLEIARKNYKTSTVAVLFILLFFTEPRFSKFFSVAPDGALSREVRTAMAEIIRSSPLVYEYRGAKRFKILRDYIRFIPQETDFVPLSYSTSRLDGRLPNVFVADEVGALPSPYAIEAMRSGQLNIKNKIGFIISTKYNTTDNPFESEVDYAKRVLDGTQKDETVFALLYEPDEITGWETDDLILKQANPAALESPEVWKDLLQKRARAVAMPSARENFLTKHCNIIYSGADAESFVEITDVQRCRRAKIDWAGRVVYLGLDLSETNDNTAVAMVSVDEDNTILAKVWAFIPEDRVDEKTVTEKLDYREQMRQGSCIACGTRVIDYGTIEDFIQTLEEREGVMIQAVGFDRWNAMSTAMKLEKAGLNMIEVKQHSSVLHPATKLLREKILAGEFAYERNQLLEINFQNARCVRDTNLNLYVTKKKSAGKVDMVVAMLDAICIMQKDYQLAEAGSDFTVQVI